MQCVVLPRAIADGGLEPTLNDRWVPDEAAAQLERYRLAPGDLVFVRMGEVGRSALVTTEHARWLPGTGCLLLRPRDDMTGLSRYLLHYLGLPATADWLRRHAGTTTVPSISMASLAALPVAIPPAPDLEAIADTLAALDRQAAHHRRVSRTAAQLRDRLLAHLLTGELSVPTARPGGDAPSL